MLSTDQDFRTKLESLHSYLQETTNQLYRSLDSLEIKVRKKDTYGEEMVREDIGEIIYRPDVALTDLYAHVVAEEDEVILDDDVTCCAESCGCSESSEKVDASQETPAEDSPLAKITDAQLHSLLAQLDNLLVDGLIVGVTIV